MSDKILCDTDIMSTLAKVDELEILEAVFPDHKFVITEYVRDELIRSKEEGFDFPDKIFQFSETTTMDENELEVYESKSSFEISKTDMKNLIIAKNRDVPLLTNDSKLYNTAVEKEVKSYDLRQMLKAVYEEKVLSEQSVRDIITKIEQKDNTKMKDVESLFE